MGRRIEVELTSSRDDGSWTWRAAGARQPKGELSGELLYSGAKVGDVVKVEADFHLDGIEVVEVFAPKDKKERTDLLELKSRPLRDDELVTTERVARGRGGGRGRRGERPNRERRERRDDRPRSARPDRPQRPKPKRLRAGRQHREALLASVPEEHRPIVEQVVRDGMPGVRAAIEKQNAEAKGAGKPEIEAAPVVSIAERHLAAARLAEWRDRADAALGDIDELDLRDLRSVVVVGNDVARDEESRAIADQLKAALDDRMERDHEQWLSDLRSAVSDGRVVRALRLSSRPVKAGSPLPTELAGELARQAAVALAPDVEPSRWAVVLDALAFSPVRGAVTPAGIPAEPGDELIDEVKRLSDRVPAIAALFGIDPAEVPKRLKRRRSPQPGGGQKRKTDKTPKQKAKERRPAKDKASKPRSDQEGKAKPDGPASDASPPAEKTAVEKPSAEAPSGQLTTDDTTEQPTANEPEARDPAAEKPAELTIDEPEAVEAEAVAEKAEEPVDEPEAQEPAAEKPAEPTVDEPEVVEPDAAVEKAEEPTVDEPEAVDPVDRLQAEPADVQSAESSTEEAEVPDDEEE